VPALLDRLHEGGSYEIGNTIAMLIDRRVSKSTGIYRIDP
jgi:hypothetical protein